MRNSPPFLLVFGLFTPRVVVTSVVCQTGWEWSFNSKGQNPCKIAGTLDAECQGVDKYEVDPLAQGGRYPNPEPEGIGQQCDCNTVIYRYTVNMDMNSEYGLIVELGCLYMACAACQNASTQPWSFWQGSCDAVNTTQYPGFIPMSTAVPNWAYLNYTVGDNFDPAAAKSAGDQPERLAQVPTTITLSESVGGLGSPSSISTSPNSVLTQTKTPISSTGSLPISSTHPKLSSSATSAPTGDGQQNDNQAKRSSPNVSAIVGGAIGGLAFLAAVGIGAWLFLRRGKGPGGEIGRGHPRDTRHSSGIVMHKNGTQPSGMRLHDTSGPLAFPDTDGYGMNGAHATPPEGLHYTGAAEL